jgi:hypothetical protein
MRTLIIGLMTTVTLAVFVATAFANPATIPKHPGYPAKEFKSPVTGQSLANDPGQTNATGTEALVEAAAFDDARSVQDLESNRNDERLLQKEPGLLPKVQGPQIKIEPPVKEGTRMTR